MMQKAHVLGFVVGIASAGLAINHGSPQFFTSHHGQLLNETLAPHRLLPGHFVDTETAAGGAVFRARPAAEGAVYPD